MCRPVGHTALARSLPPPAPRHSLPSSELGSPGGMKQPCNRVSAYRALLPVLLALHRPHRRCLHAAQHPNRYRPAGGIPTCCHHCSCKLPSPTPELPPEHCCYSWETLQESKGEITSTPRQCPLRKSVERSSRNCPSPAGGTPRVKQSEGTEHQPFLSTLATRSSHLPTAERLRMGFDEGHMSIDRLKLPPVRA